MGKLVTPWGMPTARMMGHDRFRFPEGVLNFPTVGKCYPKHFLCTKSWLCKCFMNNDTYIVKLKSHSVFEPLFIQVHVIKI